MSTVQVEYIGAKPRKIDNVAGTDAVWNGRGDVQPVPIAVWDKLSRHPDIWRIAAARQPEAEITVALNRDGTTDLVDPPIPAGGTEAPPVEADLDTLGAEALHALAKQRGVKVHHKAGADKVREALRAAA